MSNYIDYKHRHALNYVTNLQTLVHESDSNVFRIEDKNGTEVSESASIAHLIEGMKKLNEKVEKIKTGYFYGTELLKNRLVIDTVESLK